MSAPHRVVERVGVGNVESGQDGVLLVDGRTALRTRRMLVRLSIID